MKCSELTVEMIREIKSLEYKANNMQEWTNLLIAKAAKLDISYIDILKVSRS